MPRRKGKFRKYTTFVLLCISILVLIVLGLFKRELFDQFTELISEFIWPAIIALLALFGFIVGGVLKNPPKSFDAFLQNGLLQIAVLLFFLFVVSLTAFSFYSTMPGQITVLLESGNQFPQIKVLRIHDSDSDTILAPNEFPKLAAGEYTFKVIEEGYFPYEKPVHLSSGGKEVLTLVDRAISGLLYVDSEPSGAEIWIDQSLVSTTPDTVRNLEKGIHNLEIKLKGYQTYSKKIDLSSHSELNLGKVPLTKIYYLNFICQFQDIRFKINNREYVGSQTEIPVPAGNYIITYSRGNNPPQEMSVNSKSNNTFYIPPK